MKKLRIALFSPVNPRRCGVSDYTEELLPELTRLADVDIVTESYEPSNRGLRTLTIEEFPARAGEYDAPVYQIANSFDYHGFMVPMLARYPGIVVLHDFSLQYLMLGMSLMQGDLKSLEKFLKPAYGASAPGIARQLLLSRTDPYEISMVRPILEWATGIIVHSRSVHAKILEECPERAPDVRFLHMGVPVQETEPGSAGLKARYGFKESDFVVASVSTVSYTKRLDVALSAVARLKKRHKQLKFVILGGGSLGAKVRNLIARHGLQDTVLHTGWVTPEQYRDYIQLTDVVVDLRYPAGTEASASLSRAIAAGKPAIVTSHGWFRDLPAEFVMQIPKNAAEVHTIESAIESLMVDSEKRAAMGRSAWQYARQNLQISSCAQGYVDVIREILARPQRTADSARLALDPEKAKMKRLFVAAVYKSCRTLHLVKSYGVSDTFSRVRRRLARGLAGEHQS